MQDVTSCIYNVPIFKPLPEEDVARLQRVMVHRRLATGEACAHAGEPVADLIVVHRGLLRLVRTSAAGREQVLRELGPGQFYGEIALFADVVHEGDLVAARETEACVLSRRAVEEALLQNPPLTGPMLRALARRLFEAERTVGELALYDVGRRLIAELLRRAAAARGLHALGADVLLRGEASFELDGSWAQLAVGLGTTPESLSRRLKKLNAAGLVHTAGRQVVIPDAAALRDALHDGL